MFRRVVFLILGVLECLAATVLVVFAWGMPGAAEVHNGVVRVEDVTGQTSAQVARLREELRTLREQRPKLHALAENLRTQMNLATDNLKDQRIDFGGVQTMAEAPGNMAQGLDGLSDMLDADSVHRIADGFKGGADFLDDQVAPAAARAADQIDESAAALSSDVRELSRLLRRPARPQVRPPDSRQSHSVHRQPRPPQTPASTWTRSTRCATACKASRIRCPRAPTRWNRRRTSPTRRCAWWR